MEFKIEKHNLFSGIKYQIALRINGGKFLLERPCQTLTGAENMLEDIRLKMRAEGAINLNKGHSNCAIFDVRESAFTQLQKDAIFMVMQTLIKEAKADPNALHTKDSVFEMIKEVMEW